ncbi:MAG: WbuC family cupin fold metalloprotein [Campylobacterales bacterium]|nr:WbuC family cupin fold metalloprotein [Campylobacterales bacterium]
MLDNFFLDNNAKTTSYFMNAALGGISNDDISNLIKLGNKYKETVRICLHGSADDLLQMMLIFHPVPKTINPKKYISQDSIYMILDGIISMKFFDDELKVSSTIQMSQSNNSIFRIPKNQIYKIEILSEHLLFLEIRNGPFKKEEQIIFSEV